jgi:hypothetical protein
VNAAAQPVPATCGPEVFSGLIKEIGRKASGWKALLVALSNLPMGEKRTALCGTVSARIASDCNAPHGVLVLPNRDVLALIRDQDGQMVRDLAEQLVSTLKQGDVREASTFVRTFDLEHQLAQFIALVSGVGSEKAAKPERPATVKLPWAQSERHISPKDIAKIEKMFFKADVVNFIRNQTSYKLATNWEFVECNDEIFVSIEYLTKFFAQSEISSNVWLFQYFTRTLDARILYMMGPGNEGQKKRLGYSLNLNVHTVFSEDFLLYDQAVPLRTRQGQIIEFQAFDVVENSAEMPFVTNFLRGRGYRLCIDGVDRELFMLIDWESLDADVIKLRWSPEMGDPHAAPFETKLARLIGAAKLEVILCRCENETAVDWGRRVGIRHFQGWFLDSLAKPWPSDVPKPRYCIRDPNMVY